MGGLQECHMQETPIFRAKCDCSLFANFNEGSLQGNSRNCLNFVHFPE